MIVVEEYKGKIRTKSRKEESLNELRTKNPFIYKQYMAVERVLSESKNSKKDISSFLLKCSYTGWNVKKKDNNNYSITLKIDGDILNFQIGIRNEKEMENS
ncbi:MAG: hypothetical protein QXF35_03785 [Candidatus Bilamarchaeaceae archaeon]